MPSEPKRSPRPIHTDIANNIELARAFVRGMTFETFSTDVRTIYAITRCLEIISEASRRLPEAIRKRHHGVPWKQIAGSGNIYRHDYPSVSERVLWDTVQAELESLDKAVRAELALLKD